MGRRETRDLYMDSLALVHEGEERVRQAEAKRARRKSRIGIFFASIGVSKAENALAQRYLLRDQALADSKKLEPEEETPDFPSRLELM